MPRPLSKKALLLIVYLTSLLYSFSYALPLYINSSFLADMVSTEKAVGLVFAAGAVGAILATLYLPHFLKRFGNYRATRIVVLLEILVLIALGIFSNPILIVFAFICHQVLSTIIYLNSSAFLEAFSDDVSTGGVRGIFLTVTNSAFVIAPFLAGMMLTNGDFGKIYIAGAAFMVAVYILISTNFKNYVDPVYETPAFIKTFGHVWENHDLHAIIFLQFLLNFFYAWMVIYTPIYLHDHVGIPMSQILSIIIPVALMPFVIFQVYLGKIADSKLGEKEILIAGLIIISISCITISFITTASVVVWAFALFMTRVGASAVEVTTESYFYKQIKPQDMHLISFMYVVRSSAYFIGPLLGSLTLYLVPYNFIFLVLGLIMLIGIPYSMHFKDSR